MINDMLVVDAVVHGFDWSPDNFAIPVAASTTAGGFGLHNLVVPNPKERLTEEEFVRNWPIEDVAEAMWYETSTDLAVYNGTPIFDFYKDGHSPTHKGFAMREQYPERTMVYGAMDPFRPGDKWKDDLDYLVDEMKVNGLKVYAARYENGRTIEQRLDDPELGFPFIQAALDKGVKTIATHKAIPFGPVRSEPYGVSDIPEALAAFPEMNFEVIHSGFAFVEQTCFLAFNQNCWFTLETSFRICMS